MNLHAWIVLTSATETGAIGKKFGVKEQGCVTDKMC
jgi:hypothetical protein